MKGAVSLRAIGKVAAVRRDKALIQFDQGWRCGTHQEFGNTLPRCGSWLAGDLLGNGATEAGSRADSAVRQRVRNGKTAPSPARLVALRKAAARSGATVKAQEKFVTQVDTWLAELNEGEDSAATITQANIATVAAKETAEAQGAYAVAALAGLGPFGLLSSWTGGAAKAAKRGGSFSPLRIIGALLGLLALAAAGLFAMQARTKTKTKDGDG